ncbi:pyridoxamine 5'-phosphate oxidase family protein [Mucilaginibacter aquariorum]|uniref:Pyridoxamine 5'-phosphate oxidase family protein n=1 Tax=Mucilaginibacter aquariorum TaxID=2967225 RepID=A0ABT1SXC4_9SPHI|nr:pyridoxamine 5'-phosphate oxidase family protein [Mucilaginibacter aquariorum]MCQ6957003.1 pyridoxamine 5'-phosphate oxidase family protein [Mucilaginibacter aquariorum]
MKTEVDHTDMSDPIFHSGEEFIQEQSGEKGMAIRNRGIISNQLSPGAATFLINQKIFFTSSMDADGFLWASVLSGADGFLKFDESQQLDCDTTFLTSNPQELFWNNIIHMPGVGLLFIDLINRRRLRINGSFSGHNDLWQIKIKQAYPNCPKYIQRRDLLNSTGKFKAVSHEIENWVSMADTIFVASADLNGNLDVSHRGGNKGFVKYLDENTLRIPDYLGNSMFNTLGNFHINPSAGILILDFNTGDTLQLTGKATVHLNEENKDVFTGGTKRFWDFKIEKTLFSKSLSNFSSRFIDFSPYNPQ